MLRTITIAAAIAAGILTAPTAAASPAFCAPHDAGTIYIHACAHGGGGGVEFNTRLRDVVNGWATDPGHPNNPNYPGNPGPPPRPPVNP